MSPPDLADRGVPHLKTAIPVVKHEDIHDVSEDIAPGPVFENEADTIPDFGRTLLFC